MRRFPLKPLATALGIRLLDHGTGTGEHDRSDLGCRQLAERIDIPYRTVIRWRAEGIPQWRHHNGQRIDLPDHLACHYAHMHPALIWPCWLEDPDPESATVSAA